MARISDSEIRLKVLESPEFAYAAGEKLRDELTNEQAALMAHRLFSVLSRFDLSFGDYAAEIIMPILKQVLEIEIEAYKDKHCINDEVDDCSAFKEHRDTNPERYK